MEAKGGISVIDAHLIDSAAAGTMHAGVCLWLLRERFESMDSNDILRCSEQLLKAKQARDKSVALLKLDNAQYDPIDALYATDPDDEGDDDLIKSTRLARVGRKKKKR